MNRYNVYRTDKGNLTFKENGDCIFVIRCKTQNTADDGLRALIRAEKQGHDINNGKIDEEHGF